MKRYFAIVAVSGLLICGPSVTQAEALFDDGLAVPVTKGPRGPRGMPGDIVQLGDGSLLMSYTKDGGIMAVKSQDRGKTWGESSVLVPQPAPPASGWFAHPSFLRLENGQILLSYIYSTHPATPYFGHNYYRRSADEGKTWTDQFIMTPHPGYCIVHNDRLFTLSTGRILAMAEYKRYMPSTNDHSGYVALAFYSDDQGHSWQVSKNAVDMYPVEVQEADAVELKDGRLMMFARTYSGYPVRAYSEDQGETWSEGEPINELPMPYAGLPTVRRIPSSGDLVFLWISERSVDKDDPKIHRRCALTSAISKDEGKTFEHLRNIARDPEDDFGYQCIEFLDENMAVVGYHARDGLHVARIGIDWFYGK
jgi:sialidase-1